MSFKASQIPHSYIFKQSHCVQVDVIQETLTTKLHDQRNAEQFGKRVLEKMVDVLDKREGIKADLSDRSCCLMPDTVELLRVLANDDME